MTEVIYTVQSSDEADGLLGIAQRLYGDANRWPEIFEANPWVIGNNPNDIRAGQQLFIPDLDETPVSDSAARIYEVKPADVFDGLAGIAQCLYGDATRWMQIHAANKGVIGDDPRYIRPGQRLIIVLDPRRPS